LALTPGARLGIYEIIASIGVGGMGEVYRATDTTLGRQVAIKILPDAFASDPERLARFEREAKTLASLNHPHIAAIYGFEKSAGMHALVMELVEGPTLADRVAQGPISLDEALPIAKQIAEALEAAHEQGIIHRDLKPANIKVRSDGTVKVLDFGLAKAMEPTGTMSPNVSQSPTITTPAMTQAGMILGTAAYMSPEQAKGRTVDKRSDVWAFGAVLYEMVTGRRAFEGDDVSDTLARILMKEPDWTALPAAVPPAVVTVLRRCLQKDRKQRVRDLGDVSLALEGAFETTVAGTLAPGPAIQPRSLWRRTLPVVAAAVVASAMVGAAAWTLKPTPPLTVSRFKFALGEGQQINVVNYQSLAVSPDGTQLVYVANNQLYLRSMSDLEARPIPGTQQIQTPLFPVAIQTPLFPVFSPDSRSIAFFQRGRERLRRSPSTAGRRSRSVRPTPRFCG
jgi:eukaryotic-like serine/threonine-protein kinase